ncbi:MAG: HEAT repeat domain-containing protein, partial [Patescibacteria group bacterium]
GIEVVEPLIKALKSNDECIRENVVWILGEIQDIRAIEPLIEALKRETDLNVKKDIEWALKRLKNFKN